MKKKIFISIAVLVGILAAWIVLMPGKNPLTMLKKKPVITPDAAGTSATASSAQTGNAINPTGAPVKDADGFPIVYGDRGTLVAAIQEGLNMKFGSTLVVDGIYGPKTKKALSANGYTETISRQQYLEINGIS